MGSMTKRLYGAAKIAHERRLARLRAEAEAQNAADPSTDGLPESAQAASQPAQPVQPAPPSQPKGKAQKVTQSGRKAQKATQPKRSWLSWNDPEWDQWLKM